MKPRTLVYALFALVVGTLTMLPVLAQPVPQQGSMVYRPPSGGSSLSGLTTNKLTKATSASTIGDSSITDNGTIVTFTEPIVLPDGSACAAPTLHFTGAAAGSGSTLSGSLGGDGWAFCNSGSEVMQVNGYGPFIFSAAGLFLRVQATELTNATMTRNFTGQAARGAMHSYSWSNSMITDLGAVTAGDVTVATLPAKTKVDNAYVIIGGAAAGTTTLTVACGRTGAGYIDYIVASDAQAAANTVYGDTAAERGTNLTGYDLPSYTGTTDVKCHFISTGGDLAAVTGSSGTVILETTKLP